jgi:hypothetical protein
MTARKPSRNQKLGVQRPAREGFATALKTIERGAVKRWAPSGQDPSTRAPRALLDHVRVLTDIGHMVYREEMHEPPDLTERV